MSKLKDIHIEILKYMYENNDRISRVKGYTSGKISHRITTDKRVTMSEIVYLSDIGLLKKIKKRMDNTSYDAYRISPKGIEIYEKEILRMGIDEGLRKSIDEDIISLNDAGSDIVRAIFDKYKNHIDGVNNGLTYSKDFRGELKSVLEGFKLFGYKNRLDDAHGGTQVNVTTQNENTNTNTNTMNISISFEQARNDIEQNESLSPEAIAEIVQKINELEAISDETITKPQKWAKTKSVLNWLGTQGVQIAATIIPLVMKVISEVGA